MTDVIEVWSDGSGPSKRAIKGQEVRGVGGWAAVLFVVGNPFIDEISGAVEDTTSSRMEMTAVIKALQHITKPSKFLIHADSAYVVNAIRQKWIPNWRRNGWINSKGKPVANRDLWEQLVEEIARHESVSFVKVKGHRGIEHNERCDRLADKAKRQYLDTTAKVR